jgi:hypothetical protein
VAFSGGTEAISPLSLVLLPVPALQPVEAGRDARSCSQRRAQAAARCPGVSTDPARDPESTGTNREQRAYRPAVPPAPTGPQTDPHGRGAAQEIAADQRKRQPVGYFGSCRAITMRWIWLVPS